jgi:serine/threonine protein kinase
VKGLHYLHSQRLLHRDVKAGTHAFSSANTQRLCIDSSSLLFSLCQRLDNILLNSKGSAKLGTALQRNHCATTAATATTATHPPPPHFSFLQPIWGWPRKW